MNRLIAFFIFLLSVNCFAGVAVQDNFFVGADRIGFATSAGGAFEMAINAGYAGPTENVHDGTDNTYWAASATSGPAGLWDFDSTDQANTGTKSINFSSTLDGNQMQVTTGNYISTSNVVFQGYIYIESWPDEVDSDIKIQCFDDVSGTVTGNNISLKDFVNESNHDSWIKFNIPMNGDGFGLLGDYEVDSVRITMSGATAMKVPDGYFDDLRFLAGGSEVAFDIAPTPGKTLFLTKLKFVIVGPADATAAVGTAIPLNPANWMTMDTPLDNGLILQQFSRGEITTSVILKSVSEFLLMPELVIAGPYAVANDKSMIYGYLARGQVARLRSKNNDRLRVIVQDDLSPCDTFKMSFIGVEIDDQ